MSSKSFKKLFLIEDLDVLMFFLMVLNMGVNMLTPY